jgi:solute carrier family 25 uncoupling protein 27
VVARAAIAAAIAEGATFPIDSLKTRRQLERGAGGALAGPRLEPQSLRALYAGSSAAILRHLPYTGIRISAFHALQERFGTGFVSSLGSGLLAGGLAQSVAAPFDLAKIRLVADARSMQPRRYSGVIDTFVKVYRTDGVGGLWHGSLVAVQRAALVNLGELSTYSLVKQKLIQRGHQDTLRTHVASSLCSGLVSTLISNPADVVKSRMMNDKSIRSSMDCLRQCWHDEGLRGLYRGGLSTYLRLGPWQLCFWTVFETITQQQHAICQT